MWTNKKSEDVKNNKILMKHRNSHIHKYVNILAERKKDHDMHCALPSCMSLEGERKLCNQENSTYKRSKKKPNPTPLNPCHFFVRLK